ncbi:MAG: hypothetical protein M3Z37_09755 [Candidatus Eremiobacteraeota bacterium]|nr:hypothetical protein [Candidatus Eremiobacteraeota bacterium]
MDAAKTPHLKLVGSTVTVKSQQTPPAYFTARHRAWVGKSGRVHAVIPGEPRDNPLLKVGFSDGSQIVFFRLADLEVQAEPLRNPLRHGKRGSHLP